MRIERYPRFSFPDIFCARKWEEKRVRPVFSPGPKNRFLCTQGFPQVYSCSRTGFLPKMATDVMKTRVKRMIGEDWQKLDAATAAHLLGEINPHLEPVPFAAESTTVRTQKLPFYQGYLLCELTDLSAVPAARKYALHKSGDVSVLDWTNQAIYDMNERAPVILNESTVLPYVRFFFSFVRGRHGRFNIVESLDDIKWQVEPPLQGRKVMQDMLEPLRIAGKTESGAFVLEAFMIFKDSLFKTSIQVQKDGLVSMSDEELKIEGMPVLQDTAAA